MSEMTIRSANKGFRLLGKLILVAMSLALIFALSYLLGQALLSGSQPGSQDMIHFAYIDWFNQFFPTVPQWFPRGGGGVSLIHGQPILGYMLTIVVHRVFDLSLIESYRLISFLGFPLTALGIYLVALNITRSKTVGLLSAIFYLLAPASWVGLSESGSFPNHVAMIFLPLSLMCLTGFLTHHLAQSKGGQRRVWLVGLIVSLAAAIMTDRFVGSSAILLALLYTFFTSILQSRDRRGADLIRVTWGLLVAGIILLLVLAFTLVPKVHYSSLSGIANLDPSISNSFTLPSLPQFFGFAPFEIQEGVLGFHFPLIVVVPFLIGAILSFVNIREARALYIISILTIALLFIPQIQISVHNSSLVLQTLLSPQTWLQILVVLIPVGATWGVYSFVTMILNPAKILNRGHFIKEGNGTPREKLRRSVVSVLSMVLVGGLVAFVPAGSGYGPSTGSEVRGSVLSGLIAMAWPKFEISDLPLPNDEAEKMAAYLPHESMLRIDVSPHLEDFRGELLTVSDASQIHIDPGELSLIQSCWEYQRNVFYSRDLGVDELGNALSLNNAAQYYGTEYIFLDAQLDRVEIYEAAGWELVYENGGKQLWAYPESMELVSYSSKPAILITEKPGRKNYMTIYRLANDGLLPFQEAYLVEGEKAIDSYTLENLKPFAALMLTGYEYRNRSRAWDTIADYVEQGGSLFVDTGWQFAVAEWEFESAPDVLPVDRLTWTDYGMVEEYDVGSLEIVNGIDTTQFKPLIWERRPWALSGAESTDVREWGRVVLSVDGKPLIIAGEYGKGRVVWSGMNLINHALYLGKNPAELQLMHNILNWLLKGKEEEGLVRPVVERDNPDRITFSVKSAPDDDTWLFWREAYYPNWHAYLHDGAGEREIPIFRSGPGFMLMPIDASSDEFFVTLRWESSFIESVSVVVSIMGIIFLIGIAIDGLFLDGHGLTWVKIAFTLLLPRPFLDEETHRVAQKKPIRVKNILPDFQKEVTVIGDETLEPINLEDALSTEQEVLLKSWLDDKNDEDDPWVNKMLSSDRRK